MYPLTGAIYIKMQEKLGKHGKAKMQRVTQLERVTTCVTVHFLSV